MSQPLQINHLEEAFQCVRDLANDFLERIVMSLHVNSVSATCGCSLAPFIRPRGINVASAAALSTS